MKISPLKIKTMGVHRIDQHLAMAEENRRLTAEIVSLRAKNAQLEEARPMFFEAKVFHVVFAIVVVVLNATWLSLVVK